MKERLQKIKEEAIARIKESKNPESLNDVRVSVLGKKGELTALLKSMKDVAPEERPVFGQLVNDTYNKCYYLVFIKYRRCRTTTSLQD